MIGTIQRLTAHVMSRRRANGSRARALIIGTAVALALCVGAVPVLADNVDDLVKSLDDSSNKVRLAATINLRKVQDQRAILPLAKHVNVDNESDVTVRAAAAAGLGDLVNGTTKPGMKRLAVSALERAKANDPSDSVKKQADKALAAITGGTAGGTSSTTAPTASTATASASGGIYVNFGPMSSKTGTNDAANRAAMVKAATKMMTKKQSGWAQTWAGGAPTKAALAAKKMMGFYVDGTLNELKIVKAGSSATVSCKVSMLLADFPDKSVFGFLSGGAKVESGASDKDIALSADDCVSAVIEGLVETKIIPTIKTKAGVP